MQMIGGNGQFDSMKKFFNDMPPNIEIGVGWMLQSKVSSSNHSPPSDLAGASADPKTREEAASPKNDNGNPYSCLRDLAAHWPDGDPAKLRAVLMFTDGITRTNGNGQSKGDQLNDGRDGASQISPACQHRPVPLLLAGLPSVDPNRSKAASSRANRTSRSWQDTGGEALLGRPVRPGNIRSAAEQALFRVEGRWWLPLPLRATSGKFQRLDVKSTKDDIKILAPDSVMVGNVLPKNKSVASCSVVS